MTHDIRKTGAGDLPALARVAETTGLFPGDMLAEMAGPALAGESRAIWLTGLLEGAPAGFCYAEPEPLAEGTWAMLALAVDPGCHRRGIGRWLVAALEERLRRDGQRLVVVDTSSTGAFAAARAFYARAGYEEAARIRDFWAEGDDKVTFRKRL